MKSIIALALFVQSISPTVWTIDFNDEAAWLRLWNQAGYEMTDFRNLENHKKSANLLACINRTNITGITWLPVGYGRNEIREVVFCRPAIDAITPEIANIQCGIIGMKAILVRKDKIICAVNNGKEI